MKELERALHISPSRPKRGRRWAWLGLAFAAVSLGVVLSRFPTREEIQPAGERIAVLPFRVDNADLTLFADGLTDAITSRLAQYGGSDHPLPVLPASELRRGQIDAPSVARAKFGVRYAVESAIQSQDDRLRLTMTIIDTATMQQKESALLEGVRKNALALQDEAVMRLATMLNAGVQPKYAGELIG